MTEFSSSIDIVANTLQRNFFTAEAKYQLTPYETGRVIGWYLSLEWPLSFISRLLEIPVPEDAELYDLGFVDGLFAAWEASGGYRECPRNGYGI